VVDRETTSQTLEHLHTSGKSMMI